MKTLAFAAAATSAIALFAALPAGASTVVSFANFDDIVMPPGPSFIVIPTADGWTGVEDGIEIQHDDIAGNAFSQPNLVELDTFSNSSMFMNLSAGHYLVDWYYSNRPGVPASSNGISLSIGSSLLDSVTGTGAGDTVWQHRSVGFSTSGGALTFAALGTSDGLGGYLDNITISSVPEAATWALMIGGFGLAGASLRRRIRIRTA